MVRAIRKVVTGTRQQDGAGVQLVRVLGYNTVTEFDPFLMLDAFDSIDPKDYIKGFPWHPHRGIETITYLIKGKIEHGDSIGNEGAILDGCCQWMTAGGGIMHQEMPKPAERMLGIQLWLNLPKSNKMTTPTYRDIKESMIPKISNINGTVGVISGTYQNVNGAVQGDYVKVLFLDVELFPNSEWKLATNPDDTLFIYILEGEGFFEERQEELQSEKRALLFKEGDEILVHTKDRGTRFLLCAAKPIKESIAWGGPIVMNTEEELELAFQELQDGTFIKQ